MKLFLTFLLFLLPACDGCNGRNASAYGRHVVPQSSQEAYSVAPVLQSAPPVIIERDSSSGMMPAWMMLNMMNSSRPTERIIERTHVVHTAPTVVPHHFERSQTIIHAAPAKPVGRYSSGGSVSRPVSKPSKPSGGRYSSGGKRR